MPPSPEALAAGDPTFHFSRHIAAPRDLVWSCFTDCRHLVHWWGPKGFAVTHCKMDLRVGGTFHYGMETPNGTVMWGKWVFREIVKPERLVHVLCFSDPEGGVTRHIFSPDWPLLMLSTMTLTEQGGGTLLALSSAPLDASEAEVEVFRQGHESMRGGYGGTLDQLDRYLKTL